MTNTPRIVNKKQTRNSAWFRRFHLSVRIHLQEATALRSLDHVGIDHLLEIRKDWSNRINKNWGGSWKATWEKEKITKETAKNLHLMCDLLLANPVERSIMFSGNTMYIYTNHRPLIDAVCELEFLDPNHDIVVTECDVHGQPDSVYLKNPQHLYRTYLRDFRMTAETADTVKKFLAAQDDIRRGPGLEQWIKYQSVMCRNYYFFDHNSINITSMLGMISPKITRKTLPILKDK